MQATSAQTEDTAPQTRSVVHLRKRLRILLQYGSSFTAHQVYTDATIDLTGRCAGLDGSNLPRYRQLPRKFRKRSTGCGRYSASRAEIDPWARTDRGGSASIPSAMRLLWRCGRTRGK